MEDHKKSDCLCLQKQLSNLSTELELMKVSYESKIQELQKKSEEEAKNCATLVTKNSEKASLIKTLNLEFPETTLFTLYVPCKESCETTSMSISNKLQYLMFQTHAIKYQV